MQPSMKETNVANAPRAAMANVDTSCITGYGPEGLKTSEPICSFDPSRPTIGRRASYGTERSVLVQPESRASPCPGAG